MKKELITDIKDLPIYLQKQIANKIKTAEAQILVQMELNPDGLNDYLNAELKSAITQMQRLIQESQRDGVELIPISKLYVSYKEYAKKLNEYKQQINGDKTPNEPDTLPKELDNHTFKAILKKAVKAGFVKETAEGYKWSGQKNELAIFVDEVSKKLNLSNRENSNGTKQISWKPFEILFGVPNLRGAYNDIKKTGATPKSENDIIKMVNG